MYACVCAGECASVRPSVRACIGACACCAVLHRSDGACVRKLKRDGQTTPPRRRQRCVDGGKGRRDRRDVRGVHGGNNYVAFFLSPMNRPRKHLHSAFTRQVSVFLFNEPTTFSAENLPRRFGSVLQDTRDGQILPPYICAFHLGRRRRRETDMFHNFKLIILIIKYFSTDISISKRF